MMTQCLSNSREWQWCTTTQDVNKKIDTVRYLIWKRQMTETVHKKYNDAVNTTAATVYHSQQNQLVYIRFLSAYRRTSVLTVCRWYVTHFRNQADENETERKMSVPHCTQLRVSVKDDQHGLRSSSLSKFTWSTRCQVPQSITAGKTCDANIDW